MKKLFTLVCLTLAGMLASVASAAPITVTFNVDNPEHVLLEIEYAEQPLSAGDNAITFDAYSSVQISGKNGAVLESVTEENGLYSPSIWDNKVSMYPGATLDGARFIIVTKGSEDVRTASVAVKVDDASAVKAVFDETSFEAVLSDGENIVKYDPEKEKTLKIYSSVSAQVPLYSVTVEGATTGAVSRRGNVYFVSLPCDGTVNIASRFPEKDCMVAFSFADDGAAFVKKVTLNTADGEELDISEGSATVSAGSVLYIHGDNENYLLTSYKVDGYDADFTTPQRLIVRDADVNVSIAAVRYRRYSVTVTVDNPEALTARHGSTLYPGAVIDLKTGANTVEVTENMNSLLFEPSDSRNYKIASASVNGIAVEPNYDGKVQIADLADGDKIIVTTEAIVRNLHAVVYLDNAAENLWTLKDAFGNEIELTTGYNHLMLCAEDNPLTLCDGYGMPYVYANDEPVASNGSFFSKSYKFSLSEGGVAKIYVDTDDEPAFHALTFSEEGFDAVDVLADEIRPVTDRAGYEVLAGTKVEITPKEGNSVSVRLDDTDLESADGKYSFVVSGPHNIVLTREGTSGITGIEAPAAAPAAIYNLQGMRIKAASTADLPAGLYIIDGVKTLVK